VSPDRRSGLTGRYTLELKYDVSPRRPADPAAPPEVGAQPSLGTAVKEQWGLRFEKGTAPFRLVTVEASNRLRPTRSLSISRVRAGRSRQRPR